MTLSVLDLLNPADIAAAQKNVRALKLGMRVRSLVNRIRCVDGRYCLMSWSAEAVDEITYCVGLDITELKATIARWVQTLPDAENLQPARDSLSTLRI